MKDELQRLPGVGPSIAANLRRLGVRSVRDLAWRDPERLYARLCELTALRQDPCVLYTFRCAVYAARTAKPDPELLKWWNWMSAGSKTTDIVAADPRERRRTEAPPAGPQAKQRQRSKPARRL
jgi:hypothetical protein